jgi:peroxiredoxin
VVADAGVSHAPRISFLIGPDGRIAKVYPRVVPAEHVDQVLGDLA